ncbi:MAG: hypothetical protein RR844_07425 [Clostridium sp.]
MNLKKIITNTLAIVGAVVIIDKVVDLVTTKGTKAVCDALNDEDTAYDLNENCECGCGCTDTEGSEDCCQSEDTCSCNKEASAFPEIKKYEENNQRAFEYTIQGENITSEPKQV